VVKSREEVPIGTYTDENSLGDWIGLHPHLVSVYTRALVDRIAHANALVPVTDDPTLFALPGWTAADFEESLLGPSAPQPNFGWWRHVDSQHQTRPPYPSRPGSWPVRHRRGAGCASPRHQRHPCQGHRQSTIAAFRRVRRVPCSPG